MKHPYHSLMLVGGMLLSVLLSACSAMPQQSESLRVVCTIFPQYDWSREILGTEEGLTLLIQDGSDLHSYEPTAQDILTISQADVFVYVGGVSDAWVENVLKSAENPDLITVSLIEHCTALTEELTEGMQEDHDHDHDHSEEEPDEHVWLSLRNAGTLTGVLAEAFSQADPDHAEDYAAGAAAYQAQLSQLDQAYTEAVETASRKTLLFADRFPFRYLLWDYGLDYYAAFPGCSSETNASFETMTFLMEQTKALELPMILKIDGSDGSLADAIAKETGAAVGTLQSCQSVDGGSLTETHYLSLMQENLKVLQEALNP